MRFKHHQKHVGIKGSPQLGCQIMLKSDTIVRTASHSSHFVFYK